MRFAVTMRSAGDWLCCARSAAGPSNRHARATARERADMERGEREVESGPKSESVSQWVSGSEEARKARAESRKEIGERTRLLGVESAAPRWFSYLLSPFSCLPFLTH